MGRYVAVKFGHRDAIISKLRRLYNILGGIMSPWGRTPWMVPLKWRRRP